MSLRYGLLGLLNYGKMTGYELDKSFKNSLEFFWQGQTSQIYRELSVMEKAGWLSSEIEPQTGRPNRKRYTITRLGRAEFMKWLKPPKDSPDETIKNTLLVRSSFLMKIFFSGGLKSDETITMLRDFRDECRAALKKMRDVPDSIEKYKKIVKDPELAAPWFMVALYGKSHYTACEKWASDMLKIIPTRMSIRKSDTK